MRDAGQRAIVFACAWVVLLAPTTAGGASERTVTIRLHGAGNALWKLDSSREKSRLALDYRWHGAVRFAIPAPVVVDPSHRRLSASSAATLVASWTGHYASKKAGTATTCKYSGASVKARVTVKLAKGRAGNTIELTLHPRAGAGGFFSDKGRRAVVRCSPGYTQSAPSHFAPSWFFRDNLQDHGRLSSDTAIIVLPSRMLPSGAVTIGFPNERGHNDSVALGHLAWSNRGLTTVRTR